LEDETEKGRVGKIKMKQPKDFTHIRGFIYSLAKALGGRKYGSGLAKLYLRLWNPINYAMIGGIGVLINYLVWFLLISFGGLPWFLINALAIIIAWSWNWANSVGPLGWVWGFRERKKK